MAKPKDLIMVSTSELKYAAMENMQIDLIYTTQAQQMK